MQNKYNARQRAYQLGLRAERKAAWLLRFKGFHIITQRFKTHGGEIDIIARRGNLVAIVEVKARATLAQAMDALTAEAAQRIESAASYWLSLQPDYGQISLRFDLIAVLPRKIPVHIKDIFNA